MSSTKRRITGTLCLAILSGFVPPVSLAQATAQEDEAADHLATQVCARCHGLSGDSPFPWVPRLAAQRSSYLKAEILDFRTHERSELLANDVMQGQVTDIDDAAASALADYYARQPPAQGVPGDSVRIAKGRALFEQGDNTRAACTTCHGSHGEGAGIFPRLAGQHAVYLQYQLRVKQHDLRRTSIMHGMIGDLTTDDMVNLAAYLQSIP